MFNFENSKTIQFHLLCLNFSIGTKIKTLILISYFNISKRRSGLQVHELVSPPMKCKLERHCLYHSYQVVGWKQEANYQIHDKYKHLKSTVHGCLMQLLLINLGKKLYSICNYRIYFKNVIKQMKMYTKAQIPHQILLANTNPITTPQIK